MKGNSFSNGEAPSSMGGPLSGPPRTITGVQLGRPVDDRFGG